MENEKEILERHTHTLDYTKNIQNHNIFYIQRNGFKNRVMNLTEYVSLTSLCR